MTQEQLPSTESALEPAMELLDGDATAAPAAGPSLLTKIARGTMYGTVLLAATALLAVSAVPELANYATFVPEKERGGCGAMGSSGHCTTLDTVNFDSPCCAAKAAMASATEAGGCCPLSGDATEGTEAVLASTDGADSSCCATLSRASLLASGAQGACCTEEDTCPLKGSVATVDEPIDAASLLVAATAEEPADQQPAEQGTELEPNQDEVKE